MKGWKSEGMEVIKLFSANKVSRCHLNILISLGGVQWQKCEKLEYESHGKLNSTDLYGLLLKAILLKKNLSLFTHPQVVEIFDSFLLRKTNEENFNDSGKPNQMPICSNCAL